MKKLFLLLALLFLSVSVYAAGEGSGTATIRPNSVIMGQANVYFTITVNATGTTPYNANGKIYITRPDGYTDFNLTNSGAGGVTVTAVGGSIASWITDGKTLTITTNSLTAVTGKVIVGWNKVTCPSTGGNYQVKIKTAPQGGSGSSISSFPYIAISANTPTPSFTPTSVFSSTETTIETNTPTITPTITNTLTNTPIFTATATKTNTPTRTITRTNTPTFTRTNTPDLTAIATTCGENAIASLTAGVTSKDLTATPPITNAVATATQANTTFRAAATAEMTAVYKTATAVVVNAAATATMGGDTIKAHATATATSIKAAATATFAVLNATATMNITFAKMTPTKIADTVIAVMTVQDTPDWTTYATETAVVAAANYAETATPINDTYISDTQTADAWTGAAYTANDARFSGTATQVVVVYAAAISAGNAAATAGETAALVKYKETATPVKENFDAAITSAHETATAEIDNLNATATEQMIDCVGTATKTITPTFTVTRTNSQTPTFTVTATVTETMIATATVTPTITPLQTPIPPSIGAVVKSKFMEAQEKGLLYNWRDEIATAGLDTVKSYEMVMAAYDSYAFKFMASYTGQVTVRLFRIAAADSAGGTTITATNSNDDAEYMSLTADTKVYEDGGYNTTSATCVYSVTIGGGNSKEIYCPKALGGGKHYIISVESKETDNEGNMFVEFYGN